MLCTLSDERFSPLVRVVDRLQTNVFFILECAVKLGVVSVEVELRDQVVDVFGDQRAVS